MKPERLVQRKRYELSEIAKAIIAPHVSDVEQSSRSIIDHFCEITPPEVTTMPAKPDITVSKTISQISPGGKGGARSVKLGNIRLSWRKLVVASTESILSIVGAASSEWLIPLAALVVWDRMFSLLSIKIDGRHAAVIWTMWKNKDEEDCIEETKILNLVNRELKRYEFPKPTMNEEELKNILRDLEEMECIEKTDGDKWWLREWVSISYE